MELFRERPDTGQIRGTHACDVPDERAPRKVAIGRTGAGIWSGCSRGWPGISAVFLGQEPDVRTRPSRGNNCRRRSKAEVGQPKLDGRMNGFLGVVRIWRAMKS